MLSIEILILACAPAKIILRDLEEFQERYSRWSLLDLLHLKVNINNYQPISENGYIEFPKDIKFKHTIINNNDNFCFLWAVTSALYLVEHRKNSNQTSSCPHYSTVLKYDNIQFPLQLKQIPKFETPNKVSINVFTLGKIGKCKNEVVPLCFSRTNFEKHISLLIWVMNRMRRKKRRKINMMTKNLKNVMINDIRTPKNYRYMRIKDKSRVLRS